jgi:hypothetical protein
MSESDTLEPPADTMWDRAGESRLKIIFLISLNRWLVVGTLSSIGFVSLLVLTVAGPANVRNVVAGDALGAVFGSLIIAIVTSVTLVLTVSQIVLSEQIGELKDQREYLKGEVEFRDEIEDLSDSDVVPVEPNEFFRLLLAMVETRAKTIVRSVDDAGRTDELGAVLAYADAVIAHSRSVSDDLEGAEFGSFTVLLPVLHYNYAWKIHAARALQQKYDLPPAADESFDELIRILRHFAPAREYFKTHYFQWEIVNSARGTLYGAMPALAVAAYMVLAFDPAAVTGEVLGVELLYLLLAVTYVAVLLPFTVLLAYLLRILTVVKRTLDTGPFILRHSDADQVTVDVEDQQ